MSSMRRAAVVSLTLVTVAVFFFFTMMSGAASAQRIASEFGAAGAPYADPAYCKALPAIVNNFEGKVLPEQARMLREQDARLREAEAGHEEAEQEFNKALRDGILKLGTDQIGTAKVLRERVQAMKDAGLGRTARREWLEKIKNIEEMGERFQKGAAGADYAALLGQNQANLVNFMQFVEDSGASDALVKGLADMVAPGIGGLVVSGIKVGLDVVYAGLKGHFTAEEAAQWRDNVDKLRAAHHEVRDRIDGYRQDLTGGVCGPKVAQQVQNSPKPTAPQEVAKEPSVTKVPKSGSGAGTAVKAAVGIGGAVVGGLFLKNELDKLAAETSSPSGGSSGGSGSSGSSGSMTYVSGSFNCTYNAGGIVSSCANSPITVNITMKFAAGSRLKLFTEGSLQSGLYTTTSGNAPGQVTFSGFSGTQSCQPTVRTLSLMNTSVSTSVIVASVSGLSLPVVCR